eukprot:105850-Rhodomonas_salina.3
MVVVLSAYAMPGAELWCYALDAHCPVLRARMVLCGWYGMRCTERQYEVRSNRSACYAALEQWPKVRSLSLARSLSLSLSLPCSPSLSLAFSLSLALSLSLAPFLMLFLFPLLPLLPSSCSLLLHLPSPLSSFPPPLLNCH